MLIAMLVVLATLLSFIGGYYLGVYRVRARIAKNVLQWQDLLKAVQPEPKRKKKPEVYYVNSEEELQSVLKELGLDTDEEVQGMLAHPRKPEEELQ